MDFLTSTVAFSSYWTVRKYAQSNELRESSLFVHFRFDHLQNVAYLFAPLRLVVSLVFVHSPSLPPLATVPLLLKRFLSDAPRRYLPSMSATSRTGLRTTSDFPAAPDANTSSGGTALRDSLISSLNMDRGDASSDDGENLYTPISDSAQLVEIAYPPGLSDSFGQPVFEHSERATKSVISPQKTSNSFSFLSSSASPASALSSPSFASPSLDDSMLSSTSLLETRISLEDSSLDLYPSSIESALLPYSSPSKTSSMSLSPRPVPSASETIPPIQSSPRRKRPSDSQAPLHNNRQAQKPKIARVSGPEFLPSTLGSSYSARFPPNHCLRSDFVRTYSLEAELGSGGYGFVMTAKHRNEGHDVAVKFISKEKIPRYGWVTDEYGKKIPKEAWFLSRVRHPAIIQFYDLYEDDTYFYVVMELHGTPWVQKRKRGLNVFQSSREPQAGPADENVPPPIGREVVHDGKAKASKNSKHAKSALSRPAYTRRASHDLFECIEQSKHKRFGEDDAKYIFAQVVDVVDYLDQLGITHCDVKDENVVIDKDLKIKLVDFGSVVSVDPTQARPFYKTFYGTAAYASPEIIREKPYQAAPAEIWALGVLLSFLLTGMSPFPTEDDKRNGRIVLDDASRRRMSDDCYHLLQGCLEVDPQRRADIAEVKAHPWLAAGFERLRVERL